MSTLIAMYDNYDDYPNMWWSIYEGIYKNPVPGDTLDSHGRTVTTSPQSYIELGGYTLINTFGELGAFRINNCYGELKIGNGGVCNPDSIYNPDPGYNDGSIIVESGGTFRQCGNNNGNISVKSGGELILTSDVTNAGLISVEGGSCDMNGTNNIGLVVVENGTLTCELFFNQGRIIIESNGITTFDEYTGNVGQIIVYNYANVTDGNGIVNFYSPIEKRTLYYTSGATDTYPDKITSDTQVLYGKPGDYTADCINTNILYGKAIAEVNGSLSLGRRCGFWF